jgi:26S proteasome regulatory subunit N10
LHLACLVLGEIFLLSELRRPTRWEAQADAANLIFSVKTRVNAQSEVGLLSMGGKGPEVLVTHTNILGKIMDGMHRTKIGGKAHLATGIQIAGVSVVQHRPSNTPFCGFC